MMKKLMRTALMSTLACAVFTSLTSVAADLSEKKEASLSSEAGDVIPFTTMSNEPYIGFLKNWNNKKKPVLCARIHSTEEWGDLFQRLPPMSGFHASRLFPEDFFETQQILMVARVIQAPDGDTNTELFKATQIVRKDGVLTLEYQFQQPKSAASFFIKEYLLIVIPQQSYTAGTVRFVENGVPVCEVSKSGRQ